MLNRLPTQTPPLWVMLEDIGSPSPKAVAKSLGVSEVTVKKWIKHDTAPRAVLLAVFWITRWGMSAVDAEAHNAAIMSAGLARARLSEIERLQGAMHRLGRIAQFGSANDPAQGVPVDPVAPRAPVHRSKLRVEPAIGTGSTGSTPSSSTGLRRKSSRSKAL